MTPTTPRFTQEPPEAPPAATGRESNGRFAKGNAGGPGNPHARQVAALRRTLLQLVTEDEIIAIAKALLEQAKRGNVSAAKLLFAYTLGQPAKAVDPDRLPEHELDTLNANYAEPEAVTALLGRQSLADFLPVIQIAMACQQQQVKDHLAGRLAQADQEDQKKHERKEKRQARRASAAAPGGPTAAPATAEAPPEPGTPPSGNGDIGATPAAHAPAGPAAAPSGNGDNGPLPPSLGAPPSGNGANGPRVDLPGEWGWQTALPGLNELILNGSMDFLKNGHYPPKHPGG
jgi:hypothetical protein